MISLMTLILPYFVSVAEAQSDPATKEAMEAIKSISRDLDARLQDIAQIHNGPAIGIQLYKIMMMPQFAWADFYVLEGRFRKLQTGVYLVAAPIKYAPTPDLRSRSAHGVPDGDLPFFLWVEVNGEEKMNAKLEAFEIPSYEVNRENLKRTGFLIKPTQ